MYAATRGPNVKWGAQILNGGAGTTGPEASTHRAVVKIAGISKRVDVLRSSIENTGIEPGAE